MTNEVWRECRHHHHGCACREHAWEERVAALEAEVERLKEELQAEKQSAMESIGAWQIIAGEWGAKCHHLQTEVERLKDNYAALKDEFNRGAELAQRLCPKPRLGHSVFEGIPLLAAEVERLKTLTTGAQERAAIVAWLTKTIENSKCIAEVDPFLVSKTLRDCIERGDHWPEGGAP